MNLAGEVPLAMFATVAKYLPPPPPGVSPPPRPGCTFKVMTPRARVFAFGSALGLVVIGGLSALVIGGYTGEVVGLTLGSLGLGAVVLLVFLEVGLSEDRERAEDEERRQEQEARRDEAQRRSPHLRRPRRPV